MSRDSTAGVRTSHCGLQVSHSDVIVSPRLSKGSNHVCLIRR